MTGRSRRARLAACLALLGLAAGAFPGQGARAAQPVTRFSLPNGLEVVVIEDHRAPVATQMLFYRFGAADDPPGHSGTAHFFEHMMFKATEDMPAGSFSKIVAENGGTSNAATTHDHTVFFERFAADRLGLMMRLEANRMRHLVLTDPVVASERGVILEERNQRTDNNPSALLIERIYAALFLNHPDRNPIIGWRPEIESLSAAVLRAFYDRYYAPDNATLVVAGDVTPDRVRALAEKAYGPIPASGHPPGPRAVEPVQRTERRVVLRDARVKQPSLVRAYAVAPWAEKTARDAAALTVLDEILGTGRTSRLWQALVLDRKIAMGTGTSYAPFWRDVAAFGVYATPAPGHDLAEVEAGIDAVLARFAETGPTEAEMARVRRRVRAARIYGQDSIYGVARRIGSRLAIGMTLDEARGWPDLLQTVTADEVRAAALKYLVARHSVTGLLEAPAAGTPGPGKDTGSAG